MTGETPYRIATTSIFVVGMMIGGYHRHRAAKLGAKVSRRDEPLHILVPLRFFGWLGMMCLLGYLIRPAWLAWGAMPLPAWARWGGGALAVAGLPVLFWTFRTLGHNLTDTVATRANSFLVVTGPYRFVRHPFYTSGALFFVGVSLLTALWVVALLGTVAMSLLALRTPIEEAKLVERFGDDYRRYVARTGRFFPRFAAPRPSGPAGPG